MLAEIPDQTNPAIASRIESSDRLSHNNNYFLAGFTSSEESKLMIYELNPALEPIKVVKSFNIQYWIQIKEKDKVGVGRQ